jgi:hypothetical protein
VKEGRNMEEGRKARIKEYKKKKKRNTRVKE